jgi:hypothetical protein
LRTFAYIAISVATIFTVATPAYAQWVRTNGRFDGRVYSLVVSGTNLFAGEDGGVFLSTDNGTSWRAVKTTGYVDALVVSDTNLFAGAYGGVSLSTNNGASWTAVNTGLWNPIVLSLAVSGKNLFAGTGGSGVFLSTNNGTSWTTVSTGLTNPVVWSLAVSGTNLFAGTEDGVFLSTDSATSWTAVNTGLTKSTVYSLAVSGNNLFAGTWGGGVFLSADSGADWSAVNTGLTNRDIAAFAVSGTTLFAGTDVGGVFLSTDNGRSWTPVNTGLAKATVYSLAVDRCNLFAGTAYAGVWRRPLSEMITSAKHEECYLPLDFKLGQNYPNPFNPSTSISYQLATNGLVMLRVFDVLGREVETLVNERQSAGTHSVTFSAGNLPSGTYFYGLQAGNFCAAKKLLLLK